jgi:histidinol phosphatase-like enzyme
MKRKAIFFDRDGVVNKRVFGGYVKSIEEFEFEDNFFELFD